MKRLLIILTMLWSTSYAQLVVRKVVASEYLCAYYYSDSTLRTYVFSGINLLTAYNVGGNKVIDAAPLFNRMAIVDHLGQVWTNVLGTASCNRVLTDTTGANFIGLNRIYAYFFTYIALKADSADLWYGEQDTYNFYKLTAGAPIKPRKLHAPAGVKWAKLSMGLNILGLTTTGLVYEWKNGDSNYVQITSPGGPCVDLSSSQNDYEMFVYHDYSGGSATLGNLYWKGGQNGYIGDVTQRATPFKLKTLWGYSQNVKMVVTNSNTIHFVDSSNRAFGEGDNAQAEVGNGQEIVNKYNYVGTQYSWTTNKGELYTNGVCYLVMDSVKMMWDNPTYSFYKYLQRYNDSLKVWGRGKSFVTSSLHNNQEATYPNAQDYVSPVDITPLAHPTTTAANFVLPFTSAGSPQTVGVSVATLAGSATAAQMGSRGYTIAGYQWTQVSGPNTATITNPTSLSTTVTGLITGTYTFRLVMTDNNTATASGTTTVTYNPVAPPCNCTSGLKYRSYRS